MAHKLNKNKNDMECVLFGHKRNRNRKFSFGCCFFGWEMSCLGLVCLDGQQKSFKENKLSINLDLHFK